MKADDYPKIPELFFSSDTGRPFTDCLICGTDLVLSGEPYSIERAIRHYPEFHLDNVIFEYALCAKCSGDMQKEISDQTKMGIMIYFKENFNYSSRPVWKSDETDAEPFDCSPWTDSCAIKGLPKNGLLEYSLYALCISDRIIPEVAPYMISGTAQDELAELFSNKSLGFLDDFTDRYFSGPPEFKELFKGRPMLI